jgi:hypothetical protein
MLTLIWIVYKYSLYTLEKVLYFRYKTKWLALFMAKFKNINKCVVWESYEI